jgi:predicted Zn-dependent peptidase
MIHTYSVIDYGRHNASNRANPTLIAELFRKSSSRYNAAKITYLLDSQGISLTASSQWFDTLIESIMLKSMYPQNIETMLDIWRDLTITHRNLQIAKKQFIAQIEFDEKQIETQINILSIQLLFKEPLLLPITKEEVKKTSIDELMEDYHKYFCTQNFFNLGIYPDDALKKEVDFKFAHTFAPLEMKSEKIRVTIPKVFSDTAYIKIPDNQNATIRFVLPLQIQDEKEMLLAEIIAYGLSGYMNAALMKKFRIELGLTYGVSADLYFIADCSILQIEMQTKKSQARQVVNLLEEFIQSRALLEHDWQFTYDQYLAFYRYKTDNIENELNFFLYLQKLDMNYTKFSKFVFNKQDLLVDLEKFILYQNAHNLDTYCKMVFL